MVHKFSVRHYLAQFGAKSKFIYKPWFIVVISQYYHTPHNAYEHQYIRTHAHTSLCAIISLSMNFDAFRFINIYSAVYLFVCRHRYSMYTSKIFIIFFRMPHKSD